MDVLINLLILLQKSFRQPISFMHRKSKYMSHQDNNKSMSNLKELNQINHYFVNKNEILHIIFFLV